MPVSLVLKKMGEETLDEILCVGRRITTTTDEAVERRPVIATKPRESSVRCARGQLVAITASAENTPVRGAKGCSSVPQSPWGGLHGSKE